MEPAAVKVDVTAVPVVAGLTTPVKEHPVLLMDDQARVAVCGPDPIVMVEGVAVRKVMTAEGTTVIIVFRSVGVVPAAPEHRKV